MISPTLVEVRLLSSLIEAIEHQKPFGETEALREFFAADVPTDAAGWLRHVAMAKILGEPTERPKVLTSKGSGADQLFARTALAWMAWAQDDPAAWPERPLFFEGPAAQGGGEIHLMALGFWCRSVGALIRNDHQEARRYFRRSMEVGSQFGTDTSIAIQWAYAATFLESHSILRA